MAGGGPERQARALPARERGAAGGGGGGLGTPTVPPAAGSLTGAAAERAEVKGVSRLPPSSVEAAHPRRVSLAGGGRRRFLLVHRPPLTGVAGRGAGLVPAVIEPGCSGCCR